MGRLGDAWKLRHPDHAPSARYGHAMTYDPEGGRVLLYGGRVVGTCSAL